jgi:hypothetical protein
LLVVGLVCLVAASAVRPAMRSPWMMILFILNPFFVDAIFSVQFPFIWAACFFFVYVMAMDRRHYLMAGVLGWMSVSAQPVYAGPAVALYWLWTFRQSPWERRKLTVLAAVCGVALTPVAVLTLDTPALSDNGAALIFRSIIADIPRRGSILGFPFAVQALAPLLLRHYRFVAGAMAGALAIWLPFANGFMGIAEGGYIEGLKRDPRDPYAAFVASPAFLPGAHYRLLTPNDREQGYLYLARNGGVLASELFTESQFKRSFQPEQYGCFLQGKRVDFVLVEYDYFRQYHTNERDILQTLERRKEVTRIFVDPAERYEVYDVRAYRDASPVPANLAACRLRPPP